MHRISLTTTAPEKGRTTGSLAVALKSQQNSIQARFGFREIDIYIIVSHAIRSNHIFLRDLEELPATVTKDTYSHSAKATLVLSQHKYYRNETMIKGVL